MLDQDREVVARLRWVRLYEELGDAGLVCRRCGISRPPLRKWVKRFERNGMVGLLSRSRRPRSSPATKLDPATETLILCLRRDRNLGAKRIVGELRRLHDIRLSPRTVWKALKRNEVPPLRRPRRRIEPHRYSRPLRETACSSTRRKSALVFMTLTNI